MKNRFFSIMLVVLFLFNLVGMTFNASANSENNVWHTLSDGSKIIYFKDGSTLTITAPEVVSTESNNIVTRQTKTMQVSASKKDSDDEYEWIYTLYCTFSYEYGVSSVCTNAYYDQTIYKGNWTFSNGATNISGNRGTGTGLYEKKFLFITIQSINVNLTMACDIYGNVTA